MKLQDKLKRFSEMVTSAVPNVYHYFRANKDFPCAVWQESAAEPMFLNNQVAELRWEGTLDFFTKNEFDPVLDELYTKLCDEKVFREVISVQHEEDTGLIHIEMRWKY